MDPVRCDPLMILAIWSRVWLGAWAQVPIGAAGFVLLVYGLVMLDVWPTVFGATLIVLGQLRRIDRLVVFYESTR